MVYRGLWRRALDLLHSTNNLPEITGRVCPSPCEAACTLSINQPPVTIRQIELQIVERGWKEGWIVPETPPYHTGKRVAVIGSGPSGLAASQQLARTGHEAVLFEKSNRIGGILRYGIPDFKLEKWVIDRRMEQMQQEGVVFETDVEAGVDLSTHYLSSSFDAVVLTTGAGVPRDLKIPGRELRGIHFAMEFLVQQNLRLAGDDIPPEQEILAKDKAVVVIGGGDTGADCIGTSHRQKAKSIVQIELLPEPPKERSTTNPWPTWPHILRTSSSHEEGCERMWSILTKEFIGDENGRVMALRCIRLEWATGEDGRMSFTEIPGSEFTLKVDLVLLAMGFLHTEHGPLVEGFGLDKDNIGNIKVDKNLMTNVPGVFAAGDTVSGASLVVRAIDSGRKTAAAIDDWLRKQS
jgi:NAD(P)H-dependent glutamate synthase small subunit